MIATVVGLTSALVAMTPGTLAAATGVSGASSPTSHKGLSGTPWTVQPVANPAGGTNTKLLGVSCTASTVCEAVGDYTNRAGRTITLAEGWNGTVWRIQPTPVPTGSTNLSLASVSCHASDACEAVGDYTDGAGQPVTLAEAWNGTAWTIQRTANPIDTVNVSLASISCGARNACEAVGEYYASANGWRTLAERWNGKAWTIQSTVDQSGNGNFSFLEGVSCAAPTYCEAVGDYQNVNDVRIVGLVEAWNGRAWKQQPLPRLGGAGGQLNAVVCSVATVCEAVGSRFNGIAASGTATGATLAEVWNGTAWSIQHTANRPNTGLSLGSLNAVSCVGGNSCQAVGYYTSNVYQNPNIDFTEGWDGTAWKLEPTPNPGTRYSTLNAVSCITGRDCEAVGNYRSHGMVLPLALVGG